MKNIIEWIDQSEGNKDDDVELDYDYMHAHNDYEEVLATTERHEAPGKR